MLNHLKIALLTLLFFSFNMSTKSQQPVKNYDTEWKTVQGFIDKGLPQSALEEVKKIYLLAKNDKQDAQLIKALVYTSDLQQKTRENNLIASIIEFEKEITGSKEPVTSILNSLLAQMYLQYYQSHRWEIYSRTTTEHFKKEDIATWGTEDFHNKISSLYLLSIKNQKILQQTKLVPYDAIIIKGNVRHLRPTLFDLLAFRALDYFDNNERDIKKPSYAFEISVASAFDPAADFIFRKFPTKDSSSLLHKALLVYQELIAFHINDEKPDALIDADIKRLEFVNNHSTHPDKEQLYFYSINHIAHQYEDMPAAAQAWYLLAQWYNEKADSYSPYGDTTHRYSRVKAKEICERILKQKDASEGKLNASNLLGQINRQSFQFELEKVNIPDIPFRALVQYKNISKLFFRIIRADEKLREEMSNQYDTRYWPSLIAAPVIKNWDQSLPDTKDFQIHRAEIKIDALPAGNYVLIASTDKNMNATNSILGARLFYVSSIGFVNNDNDYFVVNRDNGQPLANAAVQVWENKYDYKLSKYIKEKGKHYTTSNNGFFRLEDQKRNDNNRYGNYSIYLEISFQKDRLFIDDQAYNYYYYSENQSSTNAVDINRIFLFTDRSIYRPGQTVYFKGIVLTKNEMEKNSRVNVNYSTTIFLRDANYKDVESIKVTTNEFGSFSGKFQLPKTGLNGQFTIYTKTDGGNAGIIVEEYKRPKFYVAFEPIKGTYKVNDDIKLTGTAKAYAGNNIDGATVKYRVVREPRFIYPWLFWRWWQPPAEPMEIAHGESKTDREGKFFISFNAIPDLKIDKKFEPVFDYKIYADITDINGETRSGEVLVSVSYKALILSTSIPSALPADSLKFLNIRTENLNGEFEPSQLNVSITKLDEEKRLIRKRYWERPDQFIMTKEEYIKNFPYDEYDNETDFKSWLKGEKVFSKTDSAKQDSRFPVTNDKFSPGFYVIEISARDKNGEEIKDVQYIELYDEKDPALNQPAYLWMGKSKTTIEPGDKAKIEWGTAADSLFVVQQVDRKLGAGKPGPEYYSFLKLNKEKKSFTFSTTENDRGGFGVGWMFIKHNRVYQLNQTINVPWSNKELKIEYASFREKTLPGSEEKWKVKISGYKNEKLAAEMLAGMYDASLDQFYPHSWTEPYVWEYYYNRVNWNSSQNFAEVSSFQRDLRDYDYKSVNKQYDYLFSSLSGYGLDEVIVAGYGMQKRAVMKNAAPVVEEKSVADSAVTSSFEKEQNEVSGKKDEEIKNQKPEQSGDVKVRKNFNETAFFFPDLRTDSSGAIEFSFTIPEALTKWKFQALAHTKDAAFGLSTKEIVTQKELMVQPNAPRFLREGDRMEFSSKIVNLSGQEVTGTATLELIDATTNQPVDGWFQNMVPNQYFTIAPGQSEAVRFPIEVPYLFDKALLWRIVAKAGNYSDGEENVLPVLTNRMLVTESMPLPMRNTGTKNFTFQKLLNSANSPSLQHYGLTVEYTSNPAWYAVQALPYLMEYPYECAEQTWNRYYANSLASFIANSSSKIKQVFEKWKIKDTAALLSNLQKNEELKSVLLEETPWVLQAKTESEQKRNIALLFDMVKMSEQLGNSYEKLKQMQSPNGGFVWFSGGPDDRYITQYIVTGIGHLKKLKAIANGEDAKLKAVLASAIPYLDRKIKEDYDNLIKYKTDLKKYTPGYMVIQYLYMRSFFPEYEIAKASGPAYDYFRSRMQQTWVSQSKYMQGMITLALHRTGDSKTSAAILKSLKETSITNDELGMYWKDQRYGWFWYEMPIETHSLLIEAFQEAGMDNKTVDDLKTWLLKNKQTNNWKTTKATAEACYALLLQGTNWLSNDPVVTISLGNTVVKSDENNQEAGTGYFKKTIDGSKINPQMGNINVSVENTGKATTEKAGATWGAVYWQYFEDLDKITTASTPLKLSKKLFIEKNTDRGPVLIPVNEGDVIKVGDKIKVRVELRVDRDMEYVHMKDMRASAFEPVNVLSGYKWQGGLGYYESTKDASTNFFFNYLRKGTYVFEYPLFATHTGNFSNGITTIQCMYAPEFSSHSEGVRVTIE